MHGMCVPWGGGGAARLHHSRQRRGRGAPRAYTHTCTPESQTIRQTLCVRHTRWELRRSRGRRSQDLCWRGGGDGVYQPSPPRLRYGVPQDMGGVEVARRKLRGVHGLTHVPSRQGAWSSSGLHWLTRSILASRGIARLTRRGRGTRFPTRRRWKHTPTPADRSSR